MSFAPRPCAHCGGTSFHVLPNLSTDLSEQIVHPQYGIASRKLGGGNTDWKFTLVVCAQCARTEVFTSNATDLAQKVQGAYLASSR